MYVHEYQDFKLLCSYAQPFLSSAYSTRDELRSLCLETTRDLFIDHLQVKSKVTFIHEDFKCNNVSQDCNVLIIENMFASKLLREQLFTVLLQDMQVS